MRLLNIYELPKDRRHRANAIARDILKNPRRFPDYKGQRLIYDRSVVSVPMHGGNYRLLFRDQGDLKLAFCGAATHNDYDNIINAKHSDTIKPIEMIVDPPKGQREVPPQQSLPIEPEKTVINEETVTTTPVTTERKSRRSGLTEDVTAWVLAIRTGDEFTGQQIMDNFNGSYAGVLRGLELLEAAGEIKRVPGRGERGQWMRLPSPKAETVAAETPEGLVSVITSSLAKLQAMIKPMNLADVSDDDLTLELHSRLARRKAA